MQGRGWLVITCTLALLALVCVLLLANQSNTINRTTLLQTKRAAELRKQARIKSDLAKKLLKQASSLDQEIIKEVADAKKTRLEATQNLAKANALKANYHKNVASHQANEAKLARLQKEVRLDESEEHRTRLEARNLESEARDADSRAKRAKTFALGLTAFSKSKTMSIKLKKEKVQSLLSRANKLRQQALGLDTKAKQIFANKSHDPRNLMSLMGGDKISAKAGSLNRRAKLLEARAHDVERQISLAAPSLTSSEQTAARAMAEYKKKEKTATALEAKLAHLKKLREEAQHKLDQELQLDQSLAASTDTSIRSARVEAAEEEKLRKLSEKQQHAAEQDELVAQHNRKEAMKARIRALANARAAQQMVAALAKSEHTLTVKKQP